MASSRGTSTGRPGTSALIPTDLRYTEDHLWIREEGGAARLGVTDFAQAALGDIVYVAVPRRGEHVERGRAFGWIECGKSVTDLFPPFSGIVVASNELLEKTPEEINRDPYGAGWLCVIAPEGRDDIDALMEAASYRRLIADAR